MGTSRLHRAIQRLKDQSPKVTSSTVLDLLTLTERLEGADRKFSNLTNAGAREIGDIRAELLFAWVFVGLGFEVSLEPFGRKGPDLRVSRNGQTALVEVARFVKMYPGPQKFSEDHLLLGDYGDVKRDTTKARHKIEDKFRQIGEEAGIIALWNDDEDMEETHVLTATHMIQDDAEAGLLRVPPNLAFVLYGSKWMRVRSQQQLYCYPIRRTVAACYSSWMHELENAVVRGALQRAQLKLSASRVPERGTIS